MRILATSLMAAIALMAAPAIGQTTAQTHYSSTTTPIKTLLADPAARAAIARRFPMLLQSRAVARGMADRMTLRTLKRFKPAIFTDAALTAIDADFANLPGRSQ